MSDDRRDGFQLWLLVWVCERTNDSVKAYRHNGIQKIDLQLYNILVDHQRPQPITSRKKASLELEFETCNFFLKKNVCHRN